MVTTPTTTRHTPSVASLGTEPLADSGGAGPLQLGELWAGPPQSIGSAVPSDLGLNAVVWASAGVG